jgi:hypothetical protein
MAVDTFSGWLSVSQTIKPEMLHRPYTSNIASNCCIKPGYILCTLSLRRKCCTDPSPTRLPVTAASSQGTYYAKNVYDKTIKQKSHHHNIITMDQHLVWQQHCCYDSMWWGQVEVWKSPADCMRQYCACKRTRTLAHAV